MARVNLVVGAFVVAASLPLAAEAAKVTYDFTGVADGGFGYTASTTTFFSGATFDITAVGDTAGIHLLPAPPFFPGTFATTLTSMKITVSGVGTFHPVGPEYVFNVQSNKLGGFGSNFLGDFVYFFGPSQLGSYALATNLGPLAVGGLVPKSSYPYVLTDRGYLGFANISNATFTSTVAVPEPATWTFFIVGFGLAGAVARRKCATTISQQR